MLRIHVIMGCLGVTAWFALSGGPWLMEGSLSETLLGP